MQDPISNRQQLQVASDNLDYKKMTAGPGSVTGVEEAEEKRRQEVEIPKAPASTDNTINPYRMNRPGIAQDTDFRIKSMGFNMFDELLKAIKTGGFTGSEEKHRTQVTSKKGSNQHSSTRVIGRPEGRKEVKAKQKGEETETTTTFYERQKDKDGNVTRIPKGHSSKTYKLEDDKVVRTNHDGTKDSAHVSDQEKLLRLSMGSNMLKSILSDLLEKCNSHVLLSEQEGKKKDKKETKKGGHIFGNNPLNPEDKEMVEVNVKDLDKSVTESLDEKITKKNRKNYGKSGPPIDKFKSINTFDDIYSLCKTKKANKIKQGEVASRISRREDLDFDSEQMMGASVERGKNSAVGGDKKSRHKTQEAKDDAQSVQDGNRLAERGKGDALTTFKWNKQGDTSKEETAKNFKEERSLESPQGPKQKKPAWGKSVGIFIDSDGIMKAVIGGTDVSKESLPTVYRTKAGTGMLTANSPKGITTGTTSDVKDKRTKAANMYPVGHPMREKHNKFIQTLKSIDQLTAEAVMKSANYKNDFTNWNVELPEYTMKSTGYRGCVNGNEDVNKAVLMPGDSSKATGNLVKEKNKPKLNPLEAFKAANAGRKDPPESLRNFAISPTDESGKKKALFNIGTGKQETIALSKSFDDMVSDLMKDLSARTKRLHVGVGEGKGFSVSTKKVIGEKKGKKGVAAFGARMGDDTDNGQARRELGHMFAAKYTKERSGPVKTLTPEEYLAQKEAREKVTA